MDTIDTRMELITPTGEKIVTRIRSPYPDGSVLSARKSILKHHAANRGYTEYDIVAYLPSRLNAMPAKYLLKK